MKFLCFSVKIAKQESDEYCSSIKNSPPVLQIEEKPDSNQSTNIYSPDNDKDILSDRLAKWRDRNQKIFKQLNQVVQKLTLLLEHKHGVSECSKFVWLKFHYKQIMKRLQYDIANTENPDMIPTGDWNPKTDMSYLLSHTKRFQHILHLVKEALRKCNESRPNVNNCNRGLNDHVNDSANVPVNDSVNNPVNDHDNDRVPDQFNYLVNDSINDAVNALVNDLVYDLLNDLVNNHVNELNYRI